MPIISQYIPNTIRLLLIRLIVFLLFYFIGLAIMNAQLYNANRYLLEYIGEKQGLNTSETYTVYQDAEGFIWVGTKIGASRFDGHVFENYYLADNERIGAIKCIAEDRNGTLWIGGSNGLFYYQAGVFKKLKGVNNYVNKFQQDAQGRLWIVGVDFIPFFVTEQNVLAAQAGDSLIIEHPISEQDWSSKMKNKQTWTLDIDKLGNVYFSNNGNLSYFDGKSLNLLIANQKGRFTYILAANPDSIYWGGKLDYLNKVTPQQLIPLTNRLFGEAYDTKDGIFALGASKLDFIQNDQVHTLFNLEDFGCDDYWIQGLLIDREGNFWIATYDSGVLKFSPSFIENYAKDDFPQLSTNFSLGQIDSTLLIGAHRGRVLHKDTNSFNPYFSNRPHLIHPYTGGTRAIHSYTKDDMWFALELDGLVHYHNGTFTNYRKEDEVDLLDNNHYFLFRGSNGMLWSGNNGSVTKIDVSNPQTPTFKSIIFNDEISPAEFNPVANIGVYPIFVAMVED